MHNTSYSNAQRFYDKYCSDNIESKSVLDVGSCDINGSLKPTFAKAKYVGLDMSPGKNVDVVSNSHSMPFDNSSFDIIVSSSALEHDHMFWVTFLEMCRIIKNGGYIYINAPSTGRYHGYPNDCWRFYKDAWKALAEWGNLNKYNVELIDSYIDNGNTTWNDSVGIFKVSKLVNDGR